MSDQTAGRPGTRMRIGELAAAVGVNPKTIRFYEDAGLLPPPARRPSGYRDYGPEDLSRLTFVRTAQRLGLTLADIGEILAFRDRGQRPCGYVLSALARQAAELDQRIAELEQLRDELHDLHDRAADLPDQVQDDCYCHVIEHAAPASGPIAAHRRTLPEGGGRARRHRP